MAGNACSVNWALLFIGIGLALAAFVFLGGQLVAAWLAYREAKRRMDELFQGRGDAND